MLRSFHLPPSNLAEDQPVVDLPTEDQPPPAVPTKEPQIPASSTPAPAITAPLPTTSASSVPPEPSALSTSAPTDSSEPGTTTPLLQHILLSAQDFLAIMDAVHTFSATSASFAAAHAALDERMTHTESAVSRTNAMLAQNHAILVQIQSHLGLPPISPSVPAQASSVHPPAEPTPSAQLAPAASLNLLAAAAVAAIPPATPVAPQPAQDEDDLPPAAHH